MKKAFTMIELIFVIVIIGILASIAIPKLAATRDDAAISACEGNIKVFIGDMKSYYTSKGSFLDPKTGTVAAIDAITDVNFIGTPTIDSNGDNGNFQFVCGDTSTPTPIVIFTSNVTNNPATGEPAVLLTATTQTPNNIVDIGLVSLLEKTNLASSSGVDHIIGGVKVVR